jgi:phage terminase large subunit GpA-like protein
LIRPQRSRSTEGSTTFNKRFPGGNLILTGANSSADLSSKTVRFAVDDEIDRWPFDVDGQGDPQALRRARQIAFTRAGTHKELELSTPARKHNSRIDAAYEAGDQRIWVMPCPHCGTEIDFRFEQLRFERLPPHDTHYLAQCCGVEIEAWRQRGMVTAGRWKATKPGPGRHPSFFINSLVSLLTSWDAIAAAYVESRGDPLKEQGFANLWLGESFDEFGHELDPAKIAARAEDYRRNEVPPRVGRLVLSADTQDDRFEWALWGFGPSPTSVAVEQWLIGTGVIEGDLKTDAPWDELDAIATRPWRFAGGKSFVADLAVIDSGGHHTNAVYRFVRRKPRWRALKGSSQADAIILGTPKRIEVKDRFGRVLFKVPLYFVGTHELKLWLNHALKAIERDEPMAGGLHLTREVADEAYVRQLAAERLVPHARRDGRVDYRWEKDRHQANEALDMAVYARAFAFGAWPNGLAVDRLSMDQWATLLAERHDLDPRQADLFAVAARPADGRKTSIAEWAKKLNG